MDRPTLREKIAQEVGQHAENCSWEDCSKGERDAAYRSADYILTFIPEPANKPELRQRIIEILVKPLKISYQQYADEAMVQGAINQADQILALETEQTDAMLVEARRTAKGQERERIFTVLEKGCYHILRDWVSCAICKECWQALKGE